MNKNAGPKHSKAQERAEKCGLSSRKYPLEMVLRRFGIQHLGKAKTTIVDNENFLVLVPPKLSLSKHEFFSTWKKIFLINKIAFIFRTIF